MARRPKPRRRELRKTESISKLLPKLLEDLDLDDASRGARVLRVWDRVLGAGFARHCRPEGLRNGEVLALVPDSAWMQRIQLEKPRILERFRAELGEDAPAGLRLRIGRGGG